MKEYLDFDLEIREGGPQEYPVVVDSPGGEAQGQMHFPFDDWELENKLLALENALLRSGGSQRSISPEEQTVQEFGERLFKAVLTGDIRTRYEVSLRVARQQNKGLRLKLHIQPPKLALLPWEFLYDPDSGEYLCFSSSTPLVRYVSLSRPIEQLPVTPPLRILGMVASPTDLPQLDVDKEKRLVEEAIKVLREKGLVELTWLEEQTWSALQEKMWGGPWHIFHFVGHGDFDRNNGEGRVAFSDEAGHQVILPGRNLARLLDDHRDLRLTFLNSCEGARGGEGDPFSGTAATLVRRGVPAVLAMQYQITDKAAIAFSRAFYHAVANNLPVDAAVAAARTAVSMYDTLEWGTPVLYMRSPDGRLFDIKKEETVEKESFRRYREYVQTSWTHGELREKEAKGLKEFAIELELPPSAAADIEREVMGETKEGIIERREQAAGEEQHQERLDQLYARARRSHQNQEWHAVVDVFKQISEEDQDYPDPEGLLASARESLEIAQKKEDAIRQYREGVESAWTSGELDRRQAEQLRDLANELGLTSSAVADVEREVMGDTIEEILERHEQAARKERQKHLDGLYGRAQALNRDRKWQAVLDIFSEIHAEDSAYPDPEELLQSARNALERTRKEQDTIHRYREAVVWAWVDEDLHGREAKRLRDLVNRLELSSNTAASIEREIMGETKEAILERHEQASAEHYRTAVEEASTDNELSNQEGVWLRNLASELGLSTDTAADIEREVTGETIPAILQRQRRLDELYTQARQSYEDQEWQSVVDVFERIHSEVPAFPDPEGLLASAREALDQMRKVADLYDQALRYVDGSEWQQALECLEEAQRLEPGYRDTEELLSRVRRELASPPTAKVPDLSGRAVSQASRVLASRGLKLGARSEAPSDTVSKGLITGQSPEAGRDVQAGSLVSVTISSGPSTVDVPNLVGSGYSEAKSTLEVAGLELGSVTFAPSDDMPEDRVVQQSPVSGEKVTRGSSVRITLSLGLQKVVEQTQRGPRLIDGLARICAKYTGNAYYVDDAITEEKLSNARSSFPISATERVVALLDVTRDGSGKYGLAICEKGIRWCNERTSSGGFIYRRWRSTQRGTLQWSEFADTHIDKHSGHNVMPIEIGENNIFFMTRIAMDPDDLVQLLSELQTFLKVYTQQGFTLSGDSKERIEELGVDQSKAKGSDTGRHITVEDLGSTANHREHSDTAFSVKGVSADRAQHLPLTNTIMASNADQINRLYTLGHTYEVNAVEFSPDSKFLACGSAHATVGLWRVEDPELLHGLAGHVGSVNTVAFSPDGKLLASGSEDRAVRLWRVEDGAPLRELEEHTSKVNTVAFSPDGKLLASGSDDKTVRLWGIT